MYAVDFGLCRAKNLCDRHLVGVGIKRAATSRPLTTGSSSCSWTESINVRKTLIVICFTLRKTRTITDYTITLAGVPALRTLIGTPNRTPPTATVITISKATFNQRLQSSPRRLRSWRDHVQK